MIPNDRKTSLHFGYNFKKVKALFSSLCHQCLNRSSIKEGNEQVGSHKTTYPMGHRNAISIKKCDKSTSTNRFHCEVYPELRRARRVGRSSKMGCQCGRLVHIICRRNWSHNQILRGRQVEVRSSSIVLNNQQQG